MAYVWESFKRPVISGRQHKGKTRRQGHREQALETKEMRKHKGDSQQGQGRVTIPTLIPPRSDFVESPGPSWPRLALVASLEVLGVGLGKGCSPCCFLGALRIQVENQGYEGGPSRSSLRTAGCSINLERIPIKICLSCSLWPPQYHRGETKAAHLNHVSLPTQRVDLESWHF